MISLQMPAERRSSTLECVAAECRDRRVSISGRVLVSERRGWRSMSHPCHQLGGRRADSRSERVRCVAQVVKSELATETRLAPRFIPPLVEVGSSDRCAAFPDEDTSGRFGCTEPVEVPLKLCDEKRGKRNRANSRRGLRWAQHDDPAAQFLLLLLDPQASVERIDVPSFEPEQLTLSQPHEPREQDEAPVALGDRCRDFPHSHDWPAERARRSTSAASPRRFCSKCGRDWSTFDQCLPNFGGADRSPCKNGHSHTRTISRDGRRAAPDTLRA